jgi:hypothetical protein
MAFNYKINTVLSKIREINKHKVNAAVTKCLNNTAWSEVLTAVLLKA